MHATFHVFTFKEGLLARLAHDLRLSVHDFSVTLQGGAVKATFRLGSLAVDGVAHGDAVDSKALSESDKQKIHGSMLEDVLQTRAHPEARFEGRARATGPQRFVVEGRLHLHGREQQVQVPLVHQGDTLTTSVTFEPSRFGIPPFKALAGAIRLQDRVVVRGVLLLERKDPASLLVAAEESRWTP